MLAKPAAWSVYIRLYGPDTGPTPGEAFHLPEQITEGPSGVLEPLTVTVKEAARLLGVHPYTVYRMLDDGEVAEAKVRGRRLVVYRSLVALTVTPPTEESA